MLLFKAVAQIEIKLQMIQSAFLTHIFNEFKTDSVNTDYPDEAGLENETFPEGAKQTVLVNKYERNPEARAKCIEIYGTRCCVCGLSFEHMYGSFAKDFIHVHHLKSLHTIGEQYEVDPKEDLRPVCLTVTPCSIKPKMVFQ